MPRFSFPFSFSLNSLWQTRQIQLSNICKHCFAAAAADGLLPYVTLGILWRMLGHTR
jgi:hypothetical protein